MRIWLDGALRDAETARVSVFDHGLTVGDGVFETVKTVDGGRSPSPGTCDRLARSARGLGLPEPDLDEVRRACAAVLEANPMPLGRLRITYTGGLSPLGSDRGDRTGPPCVVALGEAARAPRHHRRDHRAVDPQRTRRADRAEDHLLRRERRRARPRPRRRRASEALFANTAGQLCEGTGSNVFVVLDGELHTPPLSSGCLAGITRALVVEWTGARETDLPVRRAGAGRGGLPDLHPARRPGRAPRRRPRAARRARAR